MRARSNFAAEQAQNATEADGARGEAGANPEQARSRPKTSFLEPQLKRLGQLEEAGQAARTKRVGRDAKP
jgi:hypothetical protein